MRDRKIAVGALILGLCLGGAVSAYYGYHFFAFYWLATHEVYRVGDLREMWPALLVFGCGVVLALGSGIGLALMLIAASKDR